MTIDPVRAVRIADRTSPNAPVLATKPQTPAAAAGRGQHDHARRRLPPQHLGRGGHAVLVRQAEVHQDQVGGGLLDQPQPVPGRSRGADDVDVGLRAQGQPKKIDQRLVVIDDDDPRDRLHSLPPTPLGRPSLPPFTTLTS
jgi:hypothetical protein